MNSDTLEDPVVIGVVAAPHGVGGEVRVRLTSDGRHLREGISPVVGGVRRLIISCRHTAKGPLLRLEGVEDRGTAGSLRGCELLLDRAELDEVEDDEFYVADLIGLAAVNEEGERLGEVVESFPTPAHEVLVVRGGEGEVLIPFTGEHVPGVFMEGGRLIVRVPEE